MASGPGLPDGEGGGKGTPTAPKLYCVLCLKEGLPEALAWIGPTETMYATEDGEPICDSHGLLHNLKAEGES